MNELDTQIMMLGKQGLNSFNVFSLGVLNMSTVISFFRFVTFFKKRYFLSSKISFLEDKYLFLEPYLEKVTFTFLGLPAAASCKADLLDSPQLANKLTCRVRQYRNRIAHYYTHI